MIYKLQDGTELKGAFTLNGVKYPRKWLELSTIEDRTTLGITTEEEPIPEAVPEVVSEPSQEELFREVRLRLQGQIDLNANYLDFSSGNSLMLYAGFANAFQPMAQTFATWEASVWIEAEAYRQEVIAGTKPMLTPGEAVALMPEYPL